MKLKSLLLITIFSATLLATVSIGLNGCGDNSDKNNIPKLAQQQAKPETPKFTFKMEDYNDLSSYDQPRIQFVWQAPERTREIWSCKVDGSDLRLAMDKKLLFADTGGGPGSHSPVRSPNGRYIITSMWTDASIEKRLFDIKNQTYKPLIEGGGKPHFAWSPDSKRVLFYVSPGGLMEYNVETATLREHPYIKSYGLYIRDNDEIFAVTRTGLNVHAADGSLLRTIEIATDEQKKLINRNNYIGRMSNTLSLDGTLYHYTFDGPDGTEYNYVIDITKPRNPLYKFHLTRLQNPHFSPGNKYLYYTGFTSRNLKTGEEKSPFKRPEGNYGNVTQLTLFDPRGKQ